MSQALYRKWRPRLWEQVVGQDHVVHTLQNAIRSGRVGHAYLFAGPRGTGKTTTARLLAKAVNCLAEDLNDRPCDRCEHCLAVNEGRFLDLIEIDAASNTSVDDVRDLRDKINFAPNQGRFKVYIIDEVHMLSTAAFNALLKTLEEPPPHAIFILATTEVHKIPATVLSRCQRHEFRRIPLQLIIQHLQELAQQEKLEVSEDALTLIARQATGSLRDAISLLDQLASTGGKITLELAQTVLGTAASQLVVDLVEAIIARDPARGLELIHRAFDSGTDPRQFARQVVDYLRNLLLVRLGNSDQVDATEDQRAMMVRQAAAFEMEYLLEVLRFFNSAASEVRSGWQPGLPLELALAQSVEWQATLPVDSAPVPTQSPAAGVRSAVRLPASPEKKPQPVPDAQPDVEKLETAASMPPEPAAEVHPVPAVEPAADESKPEEESEGPSKAVLLQNWDKIRAVTKRKHLMTEGLLNSCKMIDLREGVLVLGFASSVLKSKMEKDNNLKIVSAAIKQILGWELPVVCVEVSDRGTPLQMDPSVDTEGMVNAALNLGGKIVQKE